MVAVDSGKLAGAPRAGAWRPPPVGRLRRGGARGRGRVLPALWGVYGDLGAGRVYVDGESPGGWHSGGGGGVWLGFLDRRNTLSMGVESSTEGTLVQAGAAFGF
jgi:hypothetical protein